MFEHLLLGGEVGVRRRVERFEHFLNRLHTERPAPDFHPLAGVYLSGPLQADVVDLAGCLVQLGVFVDEVLV